MPRLMSRLPCIIAFLLLTAAWPAMARDASPSAAPSLHWPAPPHRPVIRLVSTARGPADLGIRRSFWKRVAGAVRGDGREAFVRPSDVAAGGDIIYVADPGVPALWILNTRTRRSQRIRSADRVEFISPVGVTLGREGQIYLADSELARVFLFRSDGKLLGDIAEPELRRPAGLSYDLATDRLYVADSAAHTVWIFGNDGKRLGALGRRGTGDGQFNFPTHVVVARDGIVHVTDALGFRVQSFAPDGRFLSSFGRHGDGSGDLASPKGIAVDGEGHIYVVDALFDTVQIFDLEGRLLLSFGDRGDQPGQFWLPGGLFIDDADRIYVADSYNRRIQVFEYLGGGNGG